MRKNSPLVEAMEMLDIDWMEVSPAEVREDIEEKIHELNKDISTFSISEPERCVLYAEDLALFLKALVQMEGLKS